MVRAAALLLLIFCFREAPKGPARIYEADAKVLLHVSRELVTPLLYRRGVIFEYDEVNFEASFVARGLARCGTCEGREVRRPMAAR